MTDIREADAIVGVKIVDLRVFEDERGRFLETFRKEWFPERTWDIVQANRSDSKQGVLRGLHYHHHQVDYWYLAAGSIRVGLYDMRRSSSTRGHSLTIDIDSSNPKGVFVPVGVAHGFVAKQDSTLTYLVDNYYDDSDEHGVAWDDPEVGIDWGLESPILSPRDRQNPLLKNIPEQDLPV